MDRGSILYHFNLRVFFTSFLPRIPVLCISFGSSNSTELQVQVSNPGTFPNLSWVRDGEGGTSLSVYLLTAMALPPLCRGTMQHFLMQWGNRQLANSCSKPSDFRGSWY